VITAGAPAKFITAMKADRHWKRGLKPPLPA
jgi:hypothetical protein